MNGYRRLLGAGVLLIVLGAGGYVALAGGGVNPGSETGFASAQGQTFMVTSEEATTSSTAFRGVPGLRRLELCAPKDGVSATVSMDLSGGPAEVRVTMGRQDRPLQPGRATFDPGDVAQQSFSFTFSRQVSRHLPATFNVQWRATTAEPVTLHRGSLRVLHGVRSRVGCA